MKRYILLLGVLLCCIMLKAQSVTYTGRYWFDQNHEQAVTAYFNDSTWQAEIDVGLLSEGFHKFHLQIADTAMKWSSPQTYLFFKIADNIQENLNCHYWFDQNHAQIQHLPLGNGHFLLDVSDLEEGLHTVNVLLEGDALTTTKRYVFMKEPVGNLSSGYRYHCWFDQDFEHRQTDSIGDGHFLLDVTELEEGLHTVNVLLEGDALTTTKRYVFMKEPVGNLSSGYRYHCWFDQDFEHRQTDSIGDGHFLLDVSELEEGLHTVNVLLEGDALTTTKRYVFMKVPVVNPSAEFQYNLWFDNDINTMQTGWLGSGCFQLEVDQLAIGFHTVSVQLDDNGTLSAPQRYMFYKRPFGGCITKWEYWLNGDYSSKQTTELSPYVDTLDIIALLPVETWPVRSTCFHFQPNGEDPYLNAKNEIIFRFWDVDKHFIDKSTFYIDENVSEPIVADTLERNTTVSIVAPRNNQIQWFKLDAVVGDSLAFVADKACTMQLFAPSGEEVYNASGPESVTLGGLHTWEDGTYYLAVHDVMGSGETVSVTYQYLHKYAVLAYDVHLVGNGGCSTITFQGNGFNSLLDAYLVNYQNDTIHRLDIGHESNTTTTVTFNFYEVNLGVYDAVFQFYDETIRINGALEVQEPVDIVLTSTVSYPSTFLRNTPCTYTYTITNNGNMSAYAVPIFVYISTATMDGITHLEFDGMDLPSVIAGVNLDTLSETDRSFYRQWANQIGEDHHFIKLHSIDEETGDSIVIRSNYFCINLAPFEEKTIKLTITANELLNVWVTTPADIIPPLFGTQNRSGGFCCVTDKIACLLNIVCGATDLASLISNLSGAPVSTALGAANCICGVLQTGNTVASRLYCREDNPGDFMSNLRTSLAVNSYIGTVLTCAQSLIPGGRADETVNLINKITSYINVFAHPNTVYECLTSFLMKKPDCPSGNDEGGKSTPVNSLDPNDIYGYLSESGSHYMRQEIQNVQYEIEFENDTTLATAAAHTIIVRDTLDAAKFDLNSLAARSVTIGDKRLDLNGEQTFARTLDLRPELYVIAQVEQDYDPTTGIIQWTIQSLDPMTMEPTDNPYQGVLPVNYNGNGVGFIDYSINLKQAFADGTEISNRAGITFDQEEQILTPTWTNIVDAVKPTSHIEQVVPVADSLSFSFVSEDNRSGVWYHALYYRNDSTNQQWQVRKAQIFENSYTLHLDDLQTTEYLVMAVDSAGNREDKLMNAEYVFSLDSIVYYTLAVESQGCGEVSGAGTYLAGSHVVIEAIPDSGCQFEQWNDGITDNPRTVELVQDTTFVAQFSFDPSDITQTANLSNGWNWWSSYIELEGIDGLAILQSGLGTSGMMVKSQNDGYASYLNGFGWYGSLAAINNENTYQVRASEACIVDLTGAMANPTNHPIALNNGWNWIGYPVNASISVAEALSGIVPQTNDMLKSQNDGFASYLDGFGWYGSLSILNPGMGLMYKSNNANAVTLVYPNGGTRTDLKANQTAESNYWQPNLNAYADNMSVMAVVELDGNELQGENYELAAFANGEVRGSAKLMYVEPLNRYMAFLTIAGDEAVELHFGLYDTETGTVETQCVASLQYETNAVVGSFVEPYVVRFRGESDVDEWANSVNIFPNPVARGQKVSLGLPAEETGEVRVEIINAIGAVVETRRATSLQTITAPSTPGVYTLRISVEGKGTCYRKLVVE